MSNHPKRAHIMIVEDEALVAEDLKAHVEEMGHVISAIAYRGEDALTLLEGSRPDLVLMDIVLAGKVDGIDVATIIKERYQIPVVYLTAYTDREKVERAQTTEPYGYLLKPFDERELRTTISMALYKAATDHKLRDSRRWAHGVLASISDGVITTDPQGHVRYLNARAVDLTGLQADEASGRPLAEIMKLADATQQSQLRDGMTHILELGDSPAGTNHLSADLVARDGAQRPIEISLGAIEFEDGERSGLVIAFRDVTLQRRAQEALEEANSELERRVARRTESLERAKQLAEFASLAKSQFLATVSHELRTPLNPIIGYADLLKENRELPDDSRQQAAEIHHASHTLLNLINDMLELAQSDTGESSLDACAFDLVGYLQQCHQDFCQRAARKGLKCIFDLPEGPLSLLGDAPRIGRILERLWDNAIKFTDRGSVTLALEVLAAEPGRLRLKLNVMDTGIGIPDDKKPLIFDTFSQTDSSIARHHSGAGLSLALCQRLVKRMNGRIGVDDNPGGGSRFWFTLELPSGDKRS